MPKVNSGGGRHFGQMPEVPEDLCCGERSAPTAYYYILAMLPAASSTFFCYPFQPHHFRPFRSAFRHSSRNLPELPAFGWNVLPDCLLFDKTKNVKCKMLRDHPAGCRERKKSFMDVRVLFVSLLLSVDNCHRYMDSACCLWTPVYKNYIVQGQWTNID